MFADDPCAGQRGHLCHSATVPVLPWQLQDDRSLAGDRVLEQLPGLNRSEVGGRSGIGVRHTPILSATLPSVSSGYPPLRFASCACASSTTALYSARAFPQKRSRSARSAANPPGST